MSDAPSRPSGRASGARRWSPLVAWASLLLLATSWPNPNVPDVRNGDKLVHLLLYAVLGFLAWRAVATGPRERRLVPLAIAVAVAASLFGWLDEWHQAFIPGRSRSAADWYADTAGAALGIALGAASAAFNRQTST